MRYIEVPDDSHWVEVVVHKRNKPFSKSVYVGAPQGDGWQTVTHTLLDGPAGWKGLDSLTEEELFNA